MKPLLSNMPQALYWVGFLIADGYFCFHNHRIELNLSYKDENHLRAFMSYCNITKQPDIKQFSGVIHQNKVLTTTHSFRTYTYGNKLEFNQLIDKFGIKEHKSETPPSIDKLALLSDDLFCCFLLGFIDGDGWKTVGVSGRGYHSISCHKNYVDFLTYLTNRMNTILNITSKPAHIKPTKQQAIVIFSPQKSAHLKSIIENYKLIHLNRKWDIISSLPMFGNGTAKQLI